jgi:AraC-like DNA-binding protein
MTDTIITTVLEYENAFPGYHFYNPADGNTALLEKKNRCYENGTEGFVHDLISPDGIHFRYSDLAHEKPGSTVIHSSQPFFHLCFAVRNKSVFSKIKEAKPFASFGNHEYNVLYLPCQQTELKWEATSNAEVFELNLSKEFFESIIPYDHPFFYEIEKTKGQQPLTLGLANMPMTPQVTGILLDIRNCPLEQYYKRLFIKAKVIELLSVIFSHPPQMEAVTTQTNTLKTAEIEKMQQAREILHDNLQSPCSLIDLAHKVGTNENYLKKHFKQLYGNTVYGYITELRMQQAKTKLAQNEQMNCIAKSIGYKNVHHFSVAFKKYFGYSPHSVRNGSLVHL